MNDEFAGSSRKLFLVFKNVFINITVCRMPTKHVSSKKKKCTEHYLGLKSINNCCKSITIGLYIISSTTSICFYCYDEYISIEFECNFHRIPIDNRAFLSINRIKLYYWYQLNPTRFVGTFWFDHFVSTVIACSEFKWKCSWSAHLFV